MKSKLYAFLIIGSFLFLASCKTASKLYQKGDYDEAVQLAAKKLQKDPNDPKLLDIIQSSYRYAVDDHESRIRNNSQDNNELKWEWMYNEYASLQKMYDVIRKVPSVFEIVHPLDYSADILTYSEKAAEVRYDRGMAFMEQGDKQAYRNAYHEFQIAANLKPSDLAITQKMNEAWENAVTNIVILPMEEDNGYRYSSFDSYQKIDEQLLQSLRFNSGNEFVRFYSGWEATSSNIRADQIVDLRLATVNIGRSFDNRSTKRVSKQVVIKETVIRPDSIVREYGTIYADITTTNRRMNSNAMLEINVKDEDGRWLWTENVNADHSWETQFATFTGDERALSESDKQEINRRQESIPRVEDITRNLMDQLSNDALNRIRNYFSRL